MAKYISYLLTSFWIRLLKLFKRILHFKPCQLGTRILYMWFKIRFFSIMIKAVKILPRFQVNPENAKIGSSAEPITVCLTMAEGTNVVLAWNSGEPGSPDTVKNRDSVYCFSWLIFF